MKKISLKNLDLKEMSQLSREELKAIHGGGSGSGGGAKCYTSSCSLVVSNNAGGWNTYDGDCDEGVDGCYCNINQPVDIPITSNGGVSRCTIQH